MSDYYYSKIKETKWPSWTASILIPSLESPLLWNAWGKDHRDSVLLYSGENAKVLTYGLFEFPTEHGVYFCINKNIEISSEKILNFSINILDMTSASPKDESQDDW